MLQQFNNREKSLTRRFLLILGIITFIAFLVLGLMIIFWDKFPLDMPKYQRVLFGSLIIVYDVIRISRLFKKQPNEK
ncbi:hypothetical protein BEL04_22875 [Mucilaginibacter sp. PPCGB 2223]|nr:hypothetical protein BEL04_22875 [Mucilaginibacter sp. PPCGB 2223]